MQPRNAAIAVAGLCLVAGAIVWSGAQLAEPQPTFQVDPSDVNDAATLDTPETPVIEDEAPAGAAPAPEITQPSEPNEAQQTLPVTPEPDQTQEQQSGELERLPARPPLSQLAAPKSPTPPKPAMPDEWKSTRLFKPVASSAGTIEAQGYKIALKGVEPTDSNETCTFEGKEWPCGLQARTAFRSWLRGRAIACDVPPQPDPQLLVAACNMGKFDLSEWLVSSGWAKASADGPYAEAGRKALEAKKGIFGPPAATGGLNLPHLSDPEPMAFPQTGPILQEQEPEPAPVAPQPPLTGAFPPAPPSPQ